MTLPCPENPHLVPSNQSKKLLRQTHLVKRLYWYCISVTTTPASPTCAPSQWQLPVEISHLSEEQQEIVSKMLYEESSAFARDANDIGCVPSLRLAITSKDDIPVQKAYSSIPKPLYQQK